MEDKSVEKDDLISRAAVLDAIDNERKLLIEREQYGAEHVVVHHARRIIEELPAVDAIPVEWLKEQIKPYTGDVSDIGKIATNGTIKGIIRKWQKEQEAQK